MFTWRKFQLKTGISINFFAPNHGHSQADGRIGRISQKLKRDAEDLYETVGEWNKNFVENCIRELNFTTLTRHMIKRKLKVVKTIIGIKQYFMFTFDNDHDNTVLCCFFSGGAPQERTFQLLTEEEKEKERQKISNAK